MIQHNIAEEFKQSKGPDVLDHLENTLLCMVKTDSHHRTHSVHNKQNTRLDVRAQIATGFVFKMFAENILKAI